MLEEHTLVIDSKEEISKFIDKLSVSKMSINIRKNIWDSLHKNVKKIYKTYDTNEYTGNSILDVELYSKSGEMLLKLRKVIDLDSPYFIHHLSKI